MVHPSYLAFYRQHLIVIHLCLPSPNPLSVNVNRQKRNVIAGAKTPFLVSAMISPPCANLSHDLTTHRPASNSTIRTYVYATLDLGRVTLEKVRGLAGL